jgi:hypothetical protein
VTRLEDVTKFAAMHKDRDLTRPHDELGSVLDLVVITRESPDERVPRVVNPFNNINEFTAKFVE